MNLRLLLWGLPLIWALKTPLAAQGPAFFPPSSPEAQGVVSDSILSFVDRIEKEFDAVHSFMIVRHGYTVAEGWWAPYERDAPHLIFNLEQGMDTLWLGRDHYLKGTVPYPLPYTDNLEPEVAAHGAWIAPSSYKVNVYLYHSPVRVTYTFDFSKGQLMMKTDLHQALLGRRDLQTLKGTGRNK